MTDPLTELQAALGPRYEVVRQAASGGMALVYLARDLKHQREVAVKVLRPDLAATLGAERFLREIELAARLQHPHIVPVYDSGAAGGVLYFVMPFVEGESLRERLARDRQLPVDDAVRLAREAASALAYAHAHGVVHRDVKPENIMVSGGHAVVTDFGIARALESSATTQLTGLGFALGTPSYMSPEQATASADVDARTDVYSLGCVLYEMLTGEAPFAGPTAQAVMTKSVTSPRPRVRARRPDVPPALEEAIVRAMAREPAERFATMTEFADALGRAVTGAYPAAPSRRRRALVMGAATAVLVLVVGAAWFGTRAGRGGDGGAVAGAERIAVMPFSTSGPGVEYMREGMVDLLSTNLDAVGGIRAIDPRAVLRRWRERGGAGGADLATVLEIGRDLGARAVLVGSVVALGPKVRLTAELHSRDGNSLARAQVDGPADSLLGLVDGLSVELIRSVWRARTPVPQPRIGAVTTHSVRAMRAYLAGEQFYRRGWWDSAVVAFTRATEADSTFALAYFRLAVASGWGPPRGRDRGERAMEAAKRLRDRLPERDRALVTEFALYRDQDLGAVPAMRHYVATYPDDLDGWNTLGEAQFHARVALAMSPEALRAPFDTVLRMDSSLAPALIHPMNLSLMYRDSAAFARYGRMLRGVIGDSTYDRWIRRLADAVWGDVKTVSDMLASLGANTDDGLAIISGRYRPPAAGLAGALTAPRPGQASQGSRNAVRVVSLRVLVAGGRLRAASALADSLRAELRQPGRDSARAGDELDDRVRTIGHVVDFIPVAAGMAPPDRAAAYMTRYRCASPSDVHADFQCAQYALATGRPAEARRHVARARTRADLAKDRLMRGHLTASDGAADLLSGDTTRGLARLRAGIDTAAYGEYDSRGASLRFRLALALAARADTREEAIRRLRYGFDTQVEFIPLTYLALGRAHEAAGQRDEAVAAYEHFLRLWANADPELTHVTESARTALRALRRD
ncbi:MAG: protein kinase [Gemmatimonadaceae bacterium]